MKKSLEKIAREDGRFNPQVFRFVYEGLDTLRKAASERRHVNGQAICEGLRKLAVERWGRLAMLVLNNWGITTTRDLGEIVYLLIKHSWLTAQPTDSIDDFNDVFDFETAFKKQFEF